MVGMCLFVDNRFVDQRPQRFGGLQFGCVGRKKHETQALGNVQSRPLCQPALSSTRMTMRPAPAPASKNGLEMPSCTYQTTSPVAGDTKAVT